MIKNSNKIIPYEMLYEAICTTKDLVDGGIAEDELLVLKSFLKHLKKVSKLCSLLLQLLLLWS